MIEPTVVFEVAPSRYVIERKHPDQGWALIGRKSTLEEAKEYAQRAMDYAPPGSTALYRVVDTQPDAVRVGDETPRLTRRQSAILGAFTGISCGPFEAVQQYAEEKFGGPVWTHEFANETFAAQLRDLAREDFLSICYEYEGTRHPKETHHEHS